MNIQDALAHMIFLAAKSKSPETQTAMALIFSVIKAFDTIVNRHPELKGELEQVANEFLTLLDCDEDVEM